MTAHIRRALRGTIFFAALTSLTTAPAFANGTWKMVPGTMASGRAHSLTAELLDGRIAVVGGFDIDLFNGMDIYDPATNSWTPAAPPYLGRADGVLVRLHDGRLLLAAGQDSGPINEAEIYDPAANSWTPPRDIPLGTTQLAGITLADGRVLIGGGWDGFISPINRTALYDPSTDTWTLGPPMLSARAGHAFVPLPDGRVIAIGGYPDLDQPALTTTEIFDPVTNTWSAGPSSAVGHAFALTTTLQDGRILVAGGLTDHTPYSHSNSAISDVDIYDPATNTWTAGPALTLPRSLPIGGTMFDGRVIVASSDVFGVRSAEELMPGATAWTPIASPLEVGRWPAGLVFDHGQQLLIAGGLAGDWLVTGEIYKLNHKPVAAATLVNGVTQAIPGQFAAVFVSAAGSTDVDGDHLSYTWREGATVLAATSDPTPTATLGLGVGTHQITLTASDSFNETATAVLTAVVQDGTSGCQTQTDSLRAQLTDVQNQLRQAQERIAIAEGAVRVGDEAVQLALRIQFRDPSFTIPGSTPLLKLGRLIAGTLAEPASCQQSLYRTLGGKK